MTKGSRFIIVMLAVLTLSLVGVNRVRAVPITALPEERAGPGFYSALPETAKASSEVKIPEGPVHMFIRRGEHSRFELFFLDARYGYDVKDFEFYKAWCLEKDKKIGTNTLHQVRLYRYDDPDLPLPFRTMPWNEIHYIINHKTSSKTVIQEAIWYLADHGKRPISDEAMELVREAGLKGKDFQPAEGELIAIICRAEGKQAVFIELPLPAAVVEAFPVSYAPPLVMPDLSFLPPWLPLAMLPLIPPFVIAFGPTDTSYNVPDSLPHGSPPDQPWEPPVNPIPEPASMLLIGAGLAGLYAWGRNNRKA